VPALGIIIYVTLTNPLKWSAWWSVYAVARAAPTAEALKAWRKTQIGRGKILRASDFDSAVRAAQRDAGPDPHLDVMISLSRQGITPTLCRPEGHEWTLVERACIAAWNMRGIKPMIYLYDCEAVYVAPPPHTSYRDLLRLGWN
jgi:hypothetical protein